MERFARNLSFTSFHETEVSNYHEVARVSQLVPVLMRNARVLANPKFGESRGALPFRDSLKQHAFNPLIHPLEKFSCHSASLSALDSAYQRVTTLNTRRAVVMRKNA